MTIDLTSIRRVFTDRVPLQSAISSAIDPDVSQSFWSTPDRPQEDRTKEVMEVRFDEQRLINHLSLEVAHFPHRFKIQVRVSDQWVTIFDELIQSSQPPIMPYRTKTSGHPQHWGPDHWVPFSAKIEPVSTNRVRVVLQRISNGTPPYFSTYYRTSLTKSRFAIPYSLAVRHFEIGYRVKARQDLPPVPPPVIETTPDRYGSRVSYSLHEEPASNIVDGLESTQWRSEPQPVNYAVVNLYLDTRDEVGSAQIVDRFFIDPLTVGPTVNLYVSNDEPSGDFAASNDLLGGTDVVVTGTPTVITGSHIALIDDAHIDVSNRPLQWSPTEPWWTAFWLHPQFPASEAHPVADLMGYRLEIGGYQATLTAPNGEVCQADLNFGQGARTLLAAGYDGERLFIRAISAGVQTAAEVDHQPSPPSLRTIRLGGYLQGPPGQAQTHLMAMILKQEVYQEESWEEWQQDPAAYVQTTSWIGDTTTNAVLRLDPATLGPDHSTGLIGGVGDRYSGLSWRPIRRDFQLVKGYMQVPPTLARFWKFEFTNLVAQPYESFLPMNRQVKTFPVSIRDEVAPSEDGSIRYSGDETAQGFGSEAFYSDQVGRSRSRDPKNVLPTEMWYAQDPSISSILSSRNWATGWSTWHVGHAAPQWVEEGPHNYEVIQVQHQNKVGFFVGLREIRAYRVDYTAGDNTDVYREHFFDLSNWGDSNWDLEVDLNRITSGGGVSVATSKVFNSHHPVRAVQFTTQQSNAVQIAPDDDFEDPALLLNDWDNPSLWHVVGDAHATWIEPHAIRITRDPDLFPSWTPGNDGFVDPLVRPTFSYRGETTPPVSPGYAGLASPLIDTGKLGRIWAAARVTAQQDLTSPLFVQILAEDGTLLAEESKMVSKGEIAEWYVGHTLGAISPPPDSTTQPFSGSELVQPLPHPTATVTTEPTPEPPPPPDPIDMKVRIRIIQKGTSLDTWAVDTLSLFDEGILWEFSNDGKQTWVPALGIRGNPNAVLTFPETGNQLAWRARCSRPGMHIHSLQVRPWYAGRFNARPDRPFRGPNLSVYDHDPPIQEDPEWKGWHKPIPWTWWFVNHRGRPSVEFTRLRAAEDDLDDVQDVTERNVVLQRHGIDSAILTDAAHVVAQRPTLVNPLPRYMKRIENPEPPTTWPETWPSEW